MAASSRLSLVSPLRLWAVSNVLFIVIVGSSWYTSYRLTAADDQRLATVQAQTLTKSRFDDLRNRRFRDFVEGIGGEFGNLYVRTSIGGETFEFGQLPLRRHCGLASYQLFGSGPEGRADVTVCRPFVFAVWPILVVFTAYLVISGLSLAYIRRLDRHATEALAGFLRDSGVEVDAGRGLIGIMAEIRGIREQLDHARQREQALAGAQARAELAEQVAHDIRSPLGVLLRVLGSSDVPVGDDAPLVRGAVARIRGIADDLLATYRAAGKGPDGAGRVRRWTLREAVPVWPVLDALIQEKRIELRGRPQVSLRLLPFVSKEQAFARIEPVQLQRVVSNLVNNSAEAINDQPGMVTVALSCDGGRLRIRVEDDGPGIPSAILAKLGARGETHGKEDGAGLGLFHARRTVEAWGGSLELASEPGKGTTATLVLPRVAAPSAEAVLIDDDPLTRKNWEVAAKEAGRALRTYASPADFLSDVESIGKATPIFIDARLKDGVKGVDAALELHRRGFGEIYLATGEAPDVSDLPFIRGVIGKEPPWAA